MENNLPENWVETQLEEILISLESGSRPKGGVRGISNGIPSIGGEHLNDNGSFDFSNIKYVPEQFALKMNRGQIKIGDVLIVKDGATTGKTSYVNESFPHKQAFVNEHVFICRASSELISKYVFYFLWSNDGKSKILDNFQGAAQGGINTGFSSNTLVPIAPIPEQHRIVAKLGALFEKVESNKQRLEKIPKLLKRFRQSVLAAAVSGKLTQDWREKNPNIESAEELILRIQRFRKCEYEKALLKYKQNKGNKPKTPVDITFKPSTIVNDEIPDSWRITRVGNVSECLDNIRKPINKTERFSRQGNIPYYGANGQVGWIDDYLFDEDLVVIVEDETFIGRKIPFSYIIRGKTWVNNHAHVMRPLGGISVEYLNICWSYYDFTSLTSGTTGRRKLTQNALVNAEFQIAPIMEQQKIVRRVEQLFAFADKMEARYTKAKVMLNKLPQSILAKAFRGELVPQDPNDEPASMLLERIKAEKEKLAKEKKDKKSNLFKNRRT